VRFSVPSLPGPVAKAVLRVHAQTGASHGFRVSRTGAAWSESTITHANAPAVGTLLATVPAFSATSTWREIDVTSAVTGSGAYAFALTTPSGNADIYLTSKEGGHAPQLVVTTTQAPPPPPPPAPPANTSLPTVSGTAQEGQTLTASAGAWSGTAPIAYAYQWRRCDLAGASCADVSGATGASYGLGSADVSRTLRVRVTASNAAGSASATSPATAVVQAAPAPPPPPPPDEPVPGTTITTSSPWSCTGDIRNFGPLPVKVISTIANRGPNDNDNAINLRGCYGDGNPATIDLIIDVRGNGAGTGTSYDAVRIGQDARDLVVTGNAECGARHATVHQDIVQALSGRNITFVNFTSGDPETGRWTCWGAGGGWYVSHANGGIPTDLLCLRCKLATYNQNMRIDTAIRSGARDSTFGYSRSYGIFIGPDAVDPINVNNRVIRY
jgi:hypothetical protein